MKLKYNNENKFRIMQMTDLHIGAIPYDKEDYKTFNLIDKALITLKPDLLVITGDLIWTDGVINADDVFIDLMKKIDKYKVPTAIVYGNHDSEMTVTRENLRVMESYIETSVEKKNIFTIYEKENYCVEIYSKDGKDIENVLYMFDSGSYPELPIGNYDWISFEQVNWFNEVSKIYKRNSGKRDLVFMHIPVPEYWEAMNNIIDGECNETNDTISAPYINTGLFAALYINDEVDAVFSGHDHDNNFVGIHNDIKLCFGNVTGYNCYGDLPRGVRLIEFTKESNYNMETWTVADSDI